MNVFDISSVRRTPTPWGREVKKRLLDKGMMQDDLVLILTAEGFEIAKHSLSQLLYGTGTTDRIKEIQFISELLDIPFRQ